MIFTFRHTVGIDFINQPEVDISASAFYLFNIAPQPFADPAPFSVDIGLPIVDSELPFAMNTNTL